MKPSEILKEAAGPSVGRKYQHIEDLVLSNGSHGGLHAVERLKHMGEEGGSIELKWDGMPVVYWGRDEQGNFSMIPKNAWAYLKSGKTETSSGAPTVMRSPNDVKAFVLGTGSGDPKARQQFANQFASLWPYFEKISPKQGYLEGGLLFYPGNKPDGSSAMPVLNTETNTYDFTPNITTFHIPVDSELGKKIAKSKVMVAATGYYPTMGSSDEQRLPNAESLSVPGVIVQGTTYVQDPVPLDTKGLDAMEKFIKSNAKLIDNYLAPKPGLSNPGGELYTYLNKHLRTEGLLADFPDWANANLSAKKAQTMLGDPKGLKATLGAVEGLSKQKNVLINQLSQGLHGGIKQTKPEGYAQAHPGKQFNYDLPGQFIKTIDQTNWSPKESVVNEAKKGSSAVLGWGRGMGHTGHDALVTAVTHQAETTGATPYFVVSRSFGKDDPIPPETKLATYQKKFPKYAKMFSLPTAEAPTLNHVLADLATKGYTDVTLVVGADQKEAFGYLTRPDKSGVPPYKNFGLNSLTVMSRQDTKAPGSDTSKPDYHEGPRATPMRQVLLDPNKTEQEQFAVWRKAMSPSLDDKEVLDMMNTAKQNLIQFNTPKPRRKASDIKEHIAKMRPLLKEASVEQQYKMLKLMKEAYQQLDKGVAEGSQEINWIKPNFDFEWHEVEEQSRMKQVPVDVRRYYQKHFPNKDAWLKAVQNGKAVVVPPDHNYEIRNAPFDKASLQKVLAPTGHEGPIGPAKEKRVNDLFDKGQVEMPIILKTSQGLWLIGGKTRLGTANYVKGLPAKVWLIDDKQGVAEGSDSNLSYQGNCTEDDVIEHIFGDVNNFANMVEEHGDEFTVGDLVVKYDPETDVHSFYYKKQGVAEGSETAAEIDKEIEFHKLGQAAAQYKGWMNKMHAKKIRDLEAKKAALKQGVTEGYNDLSREYGGAYVKGRSDDARMTERLTRQAKAAAAKAGKTFSTSAEYRKWHAQQKEKQGVAEKMKMGATIEPMEDKEQSDPVVDATLKFYKPVMQKASEQEVDHYVEKARHLLQKTDDPAVRKKLIDIFKEGKHNPYLQGGIITAIAALLGGSAINVANSIQLTPYQTNLMMQGILNSIVPAVGARMSGKDWVDTLKYTLASLGVGVGIATVMEKDSDVIGHVAKDLTGKGAPIAKLRAARDKEQMKKRERSDGLPVEPKFDYLDEK